MMLHIFIYLIQYTWIVWYSFLSLSNLYHSSYSGHFYNWALLYNDELNQVISSEAGQHSLMILLNHCSNLIFNLTFTQSYRMQELMELSLPLQVPEPWCIRTADVDHQVVSQRAQHFHPLQVICPCVLGQLVLPQVDAQGKASYKHRHTSRRDQTNTNTGCIINMWLSCGSAAHVLNGLRAGMDQTQGRVKIIKIQQQNSALNQKLLKNIYIFEKERNPVLVVWVFWVFFSSSSESCHIYSPEYTEWLLTFTLLLLCFFPGLQPLLCILQTTAVEAIPGHTHTHTVELVKTPVY